jgi:hypothetical protein
LSVPGAIVGGLIIGARPEKLAGLRSHGGRSIEAGSRTVLALQTTGVKGLFERKNYPESRYVFFIAKTGRFKTTYQSDMNPADPAGPLSLPLLVIALVVVPFSPRLHAFSAILIRF